MTTDIVPVNEEYFKKRVFELGKIIREGGLVSFPTETVYGLGANALDAEAARKTYAAKGRPSDNPLIVHVADKKEVSRYVKEVTPLEEKLMDAFWPGPLTIVFPKKDIIPKATSGGLDTIAIRCPANEATRALIRAAGVPISGHTANLSTKPSPTTAQDVYHDMKGRIEAIIDDGPCRIGVESTVIGIEKGKIIIYRPGGTTLEMLSAFAPTVVDSALAKGNAHPKAPGMKYRHYAPDAEVVVAEGKEREIAAKICREYDAREAAGEDCIIFATKQTQPFYRGRNCVIIGDRTEPATLCASLFYSLREYGGRADVIFAEALPNDDMGLAYMNRLLRSAGFNII